LAPAPGGKEIIPESMLWLLLTGEIPSEAQVRALSKEFAENGTLDEKTIKLIDASVSFDAPSRDFDLFVLTPKSRSRSLVSSRQCIP
jgi:hypothetical protein